jgi:hypothetical protein
MKYLVEVVILAPDADDARAQVDQALEGGEPPSFLSDAHSIAAYPTWLAAAEAYMRPLKHEAYTLAPGDVDPDNGRTVERVTGSMDEPTIIYTEEDTDG